MAQEDDIFRQAVKAFYEGAQFSELEKATGKKMKYNQDFFDGYEKDLRKQIKSPKGKDAEVVEGDAE